MLSASCPGQIALIKLTSEKQRASAFQYWLQFRFFTCLLNARQRWCLRPLTENSYFVNEGNGALSCPLLERLVAPSTPCVSLALVQLLSGGICIGRFIIRVLSIESAADARSKTRPVFFAVAQHNFLNNLPESWLRWMPLTLFVAFPSAGDAISADPARIRRFFYPFLLFFPRS